MAIVVFNLDNFRALYPQFSNVSDTLLPLIFTEAELLFDNTEYSCIQNVDRRELILYMVMAHILYLQYGDADGNGGSTLVGRVSSATEGSVSVSSSLDGLGNTSAYWSQSPYGLLFWQATKVCRMPKYYPGCV